jgi:hypothetical protein
MNQVILASHGKLAQGMKDTLYQKDYDLDQSQAQYKIKDLKEIIELI